MLDGVPDPPWKTDRRKIQIANPTIRRIAAMARGRTIAELEAEIEELQTENQELQDQLDAVADIVNPDEDDDDDETNSATMIWATMMTRRRRTTPRTDTKPGNRASNGAMKSDQVADRGPGANCTIPPLHSLDPLTKEPGALSSRTRSDNLGPCIVMGKRDYPG
jgi:hypothetical protein